MCAECNVCSDDVGIDLNPFTFLFQKNDEVACLHLGQGIVMRLDDHLDLLFLVHGYVSVCAGANDFETFKKKVNERFPGNDVTSLRTLKAYIVDFGARALWPGTTFLIRRAPEKQGGKGGPHTFSGTRISVLESKSDTGEL